ncbi:MAG: hypothetical protein ACTS80_00310 [Candidatus Hodgkinia cicadicola]
MGLRADWSNEPQTEEEGPSNKTTSSDGLTSFAKCVSSNRNFTLTIPEPEGNIFRPKGNVNNFGRYLYEGSGHNLLRKSSFIIKHDSPPFGGHQSSLNSPPNV